MTVNWEAIKSAVATVSTGDPKRVDGAGYKAYKVDGVIRVDIDERMMKEGSDAAEGSQAHQRA